MAERKALCAARDYSRGKPRPLEFAALDDIDQDELDELRGVWLSRLMFNPFVGWPAETRTFEEYVEAVRG